MKLRSFAKALPRQLSSTFAVSTFVVALCVFAVVTTIELTSNSRVRSAIDENLRARAREITGLMAGQAGGAIRFGNATPIRDMLKDMVESSEGDAVGGMAVSLSGDVLAASDAPEFNRDAVQKIASEVLKTGTLTTSADGHTVAVPVVSGPEATLTGAFATQWSAQRQLSAFRKDRQASIRLAALVFLLALIGAALFQWAHVSRPLTRLARAMRDVAEESFTTQIPGVRRRDEIGRIACRLAEFRDALSAA